MPIAQHPENSLLITSILNVLGPEFHRVVPPGEGRHQRPRQKILAWQIRVGLIAHQVHFHGCFSARIRQLFGVSLSDSALSQRRDRLGLEPFDGLSPHLFNEEHVTFASEILASVIASGFCLIASRCCHVDFVSRTTHFFPSQNTFQLGSGNF